MKYVCLILFALGAGFAEGAGSRFEEALALLDRAATREAYSMLESVAPEDADFADALVELQKLHYRRQDWGKFFAYAQFYRVKLVSGTRLPVRARMISLEAMALAKHCRWATAESVLNWGLAQKDRMSREEHGELVAAREYMRLHNQFPKAALANEDQVKLPGAFSTEQAWKLEGKQLLAIAHPRSLSVKLKSECGR